MDEPIFKETDAFRQGLDIRRKWLGEAHVKQSLEQAKTESFMVPIQQFATESIWGQLWTRPELDHKTRSLLTLAILATLNMKDEIQMHTRAALANGITKEEIAEVFLHVAGYAGTPRAISAAKTARGIVEEFEAAKRDKAGGASGA